MTACVRRGVVPRVWRWGLPMAAAALALSAAGVSRAESQSQGAAKAAPVAKASPPTAQKPAPNGLNTAITVHGHWVIEVKNPDGSLVRHVEFENSLDPGFTLPINGGGIGGSLSLPGGATYLTALMSGYALPPAGSWAIILIGPNGLQNLQTTSNAPCVNAFGGECWILQNNSQSSLLAAACTDGLNNGPLPGFSCNLSAAPVVTNSIPGAQLSGSVVATASGQVSTVATLITNVCGALTTCPALFNNSGGIDSLTSSSNFPGSPVMVTSGQTIQATVAISFH